MVTTPDLERILNEKLVGIDGLDVPNRTRSKLVKQHVCRALGYPIPKSFKKIHRRFFGQMFDTYAQKANNLQVWNEGLSPSRHYVILRVDDAGTITRVMVVNGEELAQLDTTGTLTQKYQARLVPSDETEELVSATDTDLLNPHVRAGANLAEHVSPTDHPAHGLLLPLSEVFERLRGAIGRSFPDAGRDQERNRGRDSTGSSASFWGNTRGEKHFLAIEDGVRESTQSWREVLLGLISRGLTAPKLATRDGAMGFWAALEEVLVDPAALVAGAGEDLAQRFR